MEQIDTSRKFNELYNLYLNKENIEHNTISFNNYCQLWNKKITKHQNLATMKCLEELEMELSK